jgi:magnesium chelatase subunit D
VSRPVYPFTAIVGQQRMRLALLLHAVDPALGGVLVRGRKGTAKSTAVRALAGLLPEIDAVADCPFGCDPLDTTAACDDCAPRILAGERLATARRRVPVVDLPVGATEDRVVGSLDLEAAIGAGKRRLEPGLLARANRGILYIDEVNLLGDHLVDLLLDAAAMGRNHVERDGVSVSHPARVMLIGTMNPEEGDLRPQLLDRFALAVEVDGLDEPAQRVLAVRNRLAFERDPEAFVATAAADEAEERARLTAARSLLPRVVLPDELVELIAHLCVACGVDGLRADLAFHRAAAALAAYRGQLCVSEAEVRAVADLVLAHRRRRTPFEQPGMDSDTIDQAIEQCKNGQAEAPSQAQSSATEPRERSGDAAPNRQSAPPHPTASPPPQPEQPKAQPERHAQANGQTQHDSSEPAQKPQSAQRASQGSSPALSGKGAGVRCVAPAEALKLALPQGKGGQETAGRRDRARVGSRGASVRTLPLARASGQFAPAATIAAAAPYQIGRRAGVAAGGPALLLAREDVRMYQRQGRAGNLVLFVVDASGSMGARQRMAYTKGAVLGLLLDAYRKRDQTGMVVFRGESAELLLPPTNSVDLAQQRLAALPTGGRTPLAAGLTTAHAAITRALRGPRPLQPLLVLVSDGRANAAPSGSDPWRAACAAADTIRAQGWRCVVLDTEEGRSSAGFARRIADRLGATHLRLDGALDATALGAGR